MQLHNIPLKNLNNETGEAIGRAIGTMIQVADLEDDGTGRLVLESLCSNGYN